MVAKTEEEGTSTIDTVKLLLAVGVLIGGIYGYYYFEAEALLYRVLGLLGFVILALFIVYTTERGKSIVGFARDSRAEVRKVVWPTRQETVQTTLMVIVAVILIGIFLWIIDMILQELIQMIIG